MTVLVTGGAGFIGSACVVALRRAGRPVVVLDALDASLYPRAVKESNLAWAREAGGELAFVEGDVRDRRALEGLFARHRVDAVLHLAAAPGVRVSVGDPDRAFDVNVGGTLALLETARAAGVRRFVLASSSSVYGPRLETPFPEDDPADRPLSPYAASKRAMELLAHGHHAAYGLDVTCLRFFTVYGPRQRPDMAIHTFLRGVLEDAPVPLYGDGSAARDFTYVEDVARAACAALERAAGYRVLNVGSGRPVSLRELLDAVAEITGRAPRIDPRPRQPGDVEVTCADLRRAGTELGYRPEVALREGLERTWAWMCAAQSGR